MKTTFRRLGAAARALALMAGFIAAVQTANAACTGPTGNTGDIIYASNYNTMAFCNGTTWTSMAGGVSVTVNTSGGATANPAGSTGDVQFNTANALDADTGNFFWDKSYHRLGIGTNTPNAPIQVAGGLSVGTASSTLYQPNGQTLQINGGSGGSARLVFDSTVLGGAPFYIASSGSYLNIGRYAPTTLAIMTLQSDTNVGIGTTAAAVSLSVVGEVQVSSSGAVCSSGINGGAIRYTGGSLYYCNNANAWTAVGTGSGQGDRITSGTLSIIANTGSAYASLTTNGTTWGYMSSNASFIPQLQVNNLNAGNVSSTLVQTGSSSATCGISLYGTIRWNATSDTIQICNTGGWTSVASSSLPNTTTSQGQNNYAAIFSGPNTLVTDSALYVDRTNHRVGVNTASPGTDLDIASNSATSGILRLSSANTYTTIRNLDGGAGSAITDIDPIASASSDAVVRLLRNVSTTGAVGVYISKGDGNASTNTILSGNSNTLVARMVGNVAIGSRPNPLAKLDVAGSISASDAIQVGSSSLTCAAGINGAIRYNGTSNTLQICVGTVWTSLSSSTTSGGAPAGSTGDIQFNTAGSFDADTGKLYWDKTNDRLGIGTVTPTAPLDVLGSSGYLQAVFENSSGPGGIQLAGGAGGVSSSWELQAIQSGGNPSGSLIFYDRTHGRYQMTMDGATGNVGIGTTAPKDNFANGVVPLLQVENTGAAASVGIARYSNDANPPRLVLAKSRGAAVGTYAATQSGDTLGGIVFGGSVNSSDISGTGAVIASTLESAPTGINTMPANLTFTTNGGERMRVNSAGNIGIGTTSPANSLDVSGTLRAFNYVNSAGYVNPVSIAVGNNSGGTNYSRIGMGQVSTNNMFIEAADQGNTKGTLMLQPYGGYVTVRSTASPTYALTVAGDIYASSGWLRTAGATGWYSETYGGGWYMTDSTYLRNYNSKQVLLNATITAPNYTLSTGPIISTGGYWDFNGGTFDCIDFQPNPSALAASAWEHFKICRNGTKVDLTVSNNVTAAAFLYSSDKRLKSDISALTGGLAKLDALKPVSFRFTADTSKTVHLGLLAQDVQKVYPEAVQSDDKGFLKLDYPALIGPMVGMLKELKSNVFTNRDELAAAKKQIAELKADNDNLEAVNRTLKASNDNAMQRLDALERNQRVHGW